MKRENNTQDENGPKQLGDKGFKLSKGISTALTICGTLHHGKQQAR